MKNRNTRLIGALIVIVFVAAGSGFSAHHSFSAFNMQTEATITGTVRQVDWTNPHIWIWVDVANEDGVIETWAFEGMSPNYLERRGWTRRTLESGDEVTVQFRPMVNGENGGMFVRGEMPDGTVMTMGGATSQ